MKNERKPLGNKEYQLMAELEIGDLCPLCFRPLLVNKKGRILKICEGAHIYPLNPTKKEEELLKNEERLGKDVNDIDNIILLCPSCHDRYDDHKTLDEYRKLIAIKKRLINKYKAQEVYHTYEIEEEIKEVITKLSKYNIDEEIEKLSYDLLRVENKMDDSISALTKRDIINDVIQFFLFIKEQFCEIDKDNDDAFDTIAGQVKSFYMKTKRTIHNKELIFNIIVEWMDTRTDHISDRACRILSSYFVQNCEVFEEC